MDKRKWLLVAAIPLLLWAAAVPNLTGTWKLDVEKSKWGKKEQPTGVIVQIEHNEPAWKYSGIITLPNSEEKTFAYDGAIDGKEGDATSAYGPGKMTVRRVNRFAIESTFHTNDGRYTETASTSTSDARVMTRRMNLKSPEGNVSWVEIYEKR